MQRFAGVAWSITAAGAKSCASSSRTQGTDSFSTIFFASAAMIMLPKSGMAAFPDASPDEEEGCPGCGAPPKLPWLRGFPL